MRKLAILGAGGHGKVAADIALQNGWDEVCFFDDRYPAQIKNGHWPILGDSQALIGSVSDFTGAFVAIGNNRRRQEKLSALLTHGATVVTLVHPQAIISPFCSLGEGVMVVGGAVVNAFANVGFGSIINTSATVGHDCSVGECVHVAPGANVAGDVVIGRFSWVGIGSAVRQGITIGEGVTVAAGAVVVDDALDGELLMGVPARPRLEKRGVDSKAEPVS